MPFHENVQPLQCMLDLLNPHSCAHALAIIDRTPEFGYERTPGIEEARHVVGTTGEGLEVVDVNTALLQSVTNFFAECLHEGSLNRDGDPFFFARLDLRTYPIHARAVLALVEAQSPTEGQP